MVKAMSTEDRGPYADHITMQDTGPVHGHWIETEHNVFCSVSKSSQGFKPYVAVYMKDGKRVAGNPYAISRDDNGALVLQLPKTNELDEAIIVPLERIREMLEVDVK